MSAGHNFSHAIQADSQSPWHQPWIRHDGFLRSLLITTGNFAISLACGFVLRNTTKWRDTGILAALVTVWSWRSIYDYAVHLLPTSVYLYAFSVILAGYTISFNNTKASRRTQESTSTKYQFLKPLIFPCRTTHARFFPTKHSFGYSYLFVGIPVGWNESAGSLLSTDLSPQRTWFSVHADGYLARGSDLGGLRAKLNAYLTSIDVSPALFPHAYLITAPRFLGFSFNPVSFWYLYDERQTLAAMILEVNNTFDERRMYFMNRGQVDGETGPSFRTTWAKDFHVSPFNDREGSYSLTAKDLDPATARSGAEDVRMDNNIVLRSNDGKPKVVARVFSTEPAVDPAKMSAIQSFVFVAQWWWVGFLTNPRILREARTLWAKKMQVFYRPEVLASSIGRNESREETGLEPFFREYLRHVVTAATDDDDDDDDDVDLSYVPAAGPERGNKQILVRSVRGDAAKISSGDNGADIQRRIEIKVLTPAFYGEVGRAKSVAEAFENFGVNPAPGAKMVDVSNAPTLLSLLRSQESVKVQVQVRQPSGLALWKQQPHLILRNGLLTTTTLAAVFNLGWWKQRSKTRDLFVTDLDGFVAESMPDRCRTYSCLVTRVLLADRIALGFPPLLQAYALTVWVVLLLLGVRQTNYMIEGEITPGVLSKTVLILSLFHFSRAVFEIPE